MNKYSLEEKIWSYIYMSCIMDSWKPSALFWLRVLNAHVFRMTQMHYADSNANFVVNSPQTAICRLRLCPFASFPNHWEISQSIHSEKGEMMLFHKITFLMRNIFMQN